MKCQVESGVHLDSVYFDCIAVMKAMSKLKLNLASGPRGLPSMLFKRLDKHIAEPLALMLVHGQVTIIFVVSVCLSVCLCRVFLSRL